jgi:hypothetical protein
MVMTALQGHNSYISNLPTIFSYIWEVAIVVEAVKGGEHGVVTITKSFAPSVYFCF